MERKLKNSTIASLGEKLDEFSEELSPDEAAVLAGLIGMAGATLERSHAEVEPTKAVAENASITRPDPEKLPSMRALLSDAFRPDTSPAERVRPTDPYADSVGVGWLCVSWSKDYNIQMAGDRIRKEVTPKIEQPLKIEGLRTIRRP